MELLTPFIMKQRKAHGWINADYEAYQTYCAKKLQCLRRKENLQAQKRRLPSIPGVNLNQAKMLILSIERAHAKWLEHTSALGTHKVSETKTGRQMLPGFKKKDISIRNVRRVCKKSALHAIIFSKELADSEYVKQSPGTQLEARMIADAMQGIAYIQEKKHHEAVGALESASQFAQKLAAFGASSHDIYSSVLDYCDHTINFHLKSAKFNLALQRARDGDVEEDVEENETKKTDEEIISLNWRTEVSISKRLSDAVNLQSFIESARNTLERTIPVSKLEEVCSDAKLLKRWYGENPLDESYLGKCSEALELHAKSLILLRDFIVENVDVSGEHLLIVESLFKEAETCIQLEGCIHSILSSYCSAKSVPPPIQVATADSILDALGRMEQVFELITNRCSDELLSQIQNTTGLLRTKIVLWKRLAETLRCASVILHLLSPNAAVDVDSEIRNAKQAFALAKHVAVQLHEDEDDISLPDNPIWLSGSNALFYRVSWLLVGLKHTLREVGCFVPKAGATLLRRTLGTEFAKFRRDPQSALTHLRETSDPCPLEFQYVRVPVKPVWYDLMPLLLEPSEEKAKSTLAPPIPENPKPSATAEPKAQGRPLFSSWLTGGQIF